MRRVEYTRNKLVIRELRTSMRTKAPRFRSGGRRLWVATHWRSFKPANGSETTSRGKKRQVAHGHPRKTQLRHRGINEGKMKQNRRLLKQMSVSTIYVLGDERYDVGRIHFSF